MTDERLILLSQRFSKHLTPHDTAIICDYLKNAKDEDFITLQTMELKSPTIGLVLAWFLGAFGGGAFYVKKTGFGIAQIIVCLPRLSLLPPLHHLPASYWHNAF